MTEEESIDLRNILDSALVDEATKLEILNEYLDKEVNSSEADEVGLAYEIGIRSMLEIAEWQEMVKELRKVGFMDWNFGTHR